MTAHRVRFFTTILTAAALASAAAAQADRAFGQLEPGQSVVEINQADPFYDDSWTPVIKPQPQADTPTAPEETETSQAETRPSSPNVPPIGGFLSPEQIETRTAQADAASRARAQQLTQERARQDTPTGLNPSSTGPSSLVTQPASAESQKVIPPVNTDTVAAGPQATPSTNWIRDKFKAQNPAVQTMLALGMVIFLIYILAWTYRRLSAHQGGVAGLNAGRAPSGLLEVLGGYPIGNKQSLVLLKFDRRVLLLSQGPSGKGGVEMKTLCELDEPEDVASVLIKVRDADGDSLNNAFKSAMTRAELGSGPATRIVEPKQSARPARPTPPPATPAAQVVPGHHDPFSGFGGQPIGPTRQVKSNPDGDRAELWSDPEDTAPGSDPVAALRERLEAMRRGERVT